MNPPVTLDRGVHTPRSPRSRDSLIRALRTFLPPPWYDKTRRATLIPSRLAAFEDSHGYLRSRLLPARRAELPRVDLTHSTAAAFCGIPCIIAKLKWGTPYLLTEHGVYLREQYLNLGASAKSLYVRWFLFRLVNMIVDLNYAHADQVSPVCHYNTRWESWRHVDAARIRVIHNGADPVRFSPSPRQPNTRPTVVSVGLIFPLKGQLGLIEAAARVRQSVPDVHFKLYGSASDEQYFRSCRERVAALGLEAHVTFAGTTSEPWTVFREADVVALASISEAFPYALVEAMLTSAAVIATDVGGVREALGQTGLLVPPHDPAALAEGITALLRNADERERLGRQARERALQWFTERRFVDAYRQTYAAIASRDAPHVPLVFATPGQAAVCGAEGGLAPAEAVQL